jgi:zinc/manganese transport system substrate-binding protein
MKHILFAFALLALPLPAGAVEIVAAENFYGDIAQQIGSPDVKVASILSSPDQDPHLFEATPSVARAISRARIVVVSGIGYDPWMEKLINASRNPNRRIINVAALSGRRMGDNPHIWYDVRTIKLYAVALTEALAAEDPGRADGFHQRLAQFEETLEPIEAQIAALRAHDTDAAVTATEPVLGYLFDALGLRSRNARFQLAVMNDTEPAASDVAAFEDDLRLHRVKLLVYNSQATDPIAERMERIAHLAGVPVVGATETEPPGKSYQAWMRSTLGDLAKALSHDGN